MLSPQSRRGQNNSLVYQRNDHITDFFLLFFKKLLKIFFRNFFFDDFFYWENCFQPPDQGWRTRGPSRNFCGGIQWFFDILSFAQFFSNAAHRPIRVGHPCFRQIFRDFFGLFLVRGFDRWVKKSQNQNLEESLSGLWATRFPTVGFECSAK